MVTVSHYLSTGLLTHFHSHGCQYLSNCNSPPRTGILPAISDCCNYVKVSLLPESPAVFVFHRELLFPPMPRLRGHRRGWPASLPAPRAPHAVSCVPVAPL